MYYKRTLILNDINNRASAKKGIISFENNMGHIKGQLRLYNFKDLPRDVALGITSGGDIVKVPLKLNDNIVDFEVKSGINLQEKLSCALVDVSQLASPQIVIGGTSNYLNDWADRVEQAFTEESRVLEREEIYENNIEEIENEISTVLRDDKEYKDCSMCAKCKYKEAFYNNEKQKIEEPRRNENLEKINELLSNATLGKDNSKIENIESSSILQNKNDNEIASEDIIIPNSIDSDTPSNGSDENNKQDNEKAQEDDSISDNSNEACENDFYEQIKDKIDNLFKNHSREENLENIIPNSKWVKVEYEDMPGHYVMGLIYDEDKLKFISYGLPSASDKNPPEDLAEYAQWLPLSSDSGNGYWLVYQSAEDGESIKVE